MLTLCSECHNHYDDESQTEECFGPGRVAGTRNGIQSSHKNLRSTTAITAHVEDTRAARGLEPLDGTVEGRVRARTAP